MTKLTLLISVVTAAAQDGACFRFQLDL